MPVSLPVIVNGRIDQPGDVDVYAFAATAGTELVADVNARRLGSPLDSVIKLTTADGEQIAFADDWYNKTEGLLTHHADARIEMVLPADGTYYLHIADAQHRGGRAYAYRLRLEARKPDFELRAVPPSLNLRQDSTAAFTVYALRQHGFTNDITISATALPTGLILSGGVIPGDRESVQMTLTVTNALPTNVCRPGARRASHRERAFAHPPRDSCAGPDAGLLLPPSRAVRTVARLRLGRTQRL